MIDRLAKFGSLGTRSLSSISEQHVLVFWALRYCVAVFLKNSNNATPQPHQRNSPLQTHLPLASRLPPLLDTPERPLHPPNPQRPCSPRVCFSPAERLPRERGRTGNDTPAPRAQAVRESAFDVRRRRGRWQELKTT